MNIGKKYNLVQGTEAINLNIRVKEGVKFPNTSSNLFSLTYTYYHTSSGWSYTNYRLAPTGFIDIYPTIDTSNVTDMSEMFAKATSANPDVSRWNTRSLVDAYHIFYNSLINNLDISNWDLRNMHYLQHSFTNTKTRDTKIKSFDFKTQNWGNPEELVYFDQLFYLNKRVDIKLPKKIIRYRSPGGKFLYRFSDNDNRVAGVTVRRSSLYI